MRGYQGTHQTRQMLPKRRAGRDRCCKAMPKAPSAPTPAPEDHFRRKYRGHNQQGRRSQIDRPKLIQPLFGNHRHFRRPPGKVLRAGMSTSPYLKQCANRSAALSWHTAFDFSSICPTQMSVSDAYCKSHCLRSRSGGFEGGRDEPSRKIGKPSIGKGNENGGGIRPWQPMQSATPFGAELFAAAGRSTCPSRVGVKKAS